MAESPADAADPTTGCKPAVLQTISEGHLSSAKQLRFGISVAEYMHYASITRAREKVANEEFLRERGSTTLKGRIQDLFKAKRMGSQSQEPASVDTMDPHHSTSEKHPTTQKDHSVVQTLALDSAGAIAVPAPADELRNANRALRTAGWGSVFYLIMLDIMGPSGTP